MTTRRFSRSRVLLAAPLAALLFALALPWPRAADAHVALRRSAPASGATLSRVPRELRLTFTEAPELALSQVELIGPDSIPVLLGPLHAARDSARVLVAEVRGPLAAGRYRVLWRIASRDGHPVQGAFSFTIAAGAEGLAAPAPPAPPVTGESMHDPEGRRPGSATAVAGPETEEAGFGVGSPLYALVRWIHYAALVGVIGAVAFALLVLPRFVVGRGAAGLALANAAFPRAATAGMWAAAFLGLTAVARLAAQSAAMRAAAPRAGTATLLGHTLWGRAWLVEAAATVAMLAAFAYTRRARPSSRPIATSMNGWLTALVAAMALAIAAALSGHAAAAPRAASLLVFVDGLHVLCAAAWLGGLLSLLIVGLPVATSAGPEDRAANVAGLVSAFSPFALAFAATVVVTGTVVAWAHLGSLAMLWRSAYGKTLLAKLAAVALVFAAGAYNWRRLTPALGAHGGDARLRRSAAVELAFGALVLIVTAVLVATPTPGGPE